MFPLSNFEIRNGSDIGDSFSTVITQQFVDTPCSCDQGIKRKEEFKNEEEIS